MDVDVIDVDVDGGDAVNMRYDPMHVADGVVSMIMHYIRRLKSILSWVLGYSTQ